MNKKFLIALALLIPLKAFASSSAPFIVADIRMIYVPAFRTFFASEYKPSDRNVALLKSRSTKIGSITIIHEAGDQVTDLRYCRASYPVYMPGKVTYEAYLAEAIKAELIEAGMFSEAVGAPIVLRITTIDFASFGTGKWTIEATVSAQSDNNYVIKHELEFPVSLEAGAACGQVARALVPTLQEFFYALYASAAFGGNEKIMTPPTPLSPTSAHP